jgi:hypothetical protein
MTFDVVKDDRGRRMRLGTRAALLLPALARIVKSASTLVLDTAIPRTGAANPAEYIVANGGRACRLLDKPGLKS